MYHIKHASGSETVYQTIDELSAAVHGGVVTADALIYHQRADRWLAVTNHPHYQIALSRPRTPPRPPSTQQPDASRRQVIQAVRAPVQESPELPATRVAPRIVPEVPQTVVRAQPLQVVAQPGKGPEAGKPVRRLTIPAARISDPEPAQQAPRNGAGAPIQPHHQPIPNGNGTEHRNVAAPRQTTVLPQRSAAPPSATNHEAPAPAPTSQVPDLGERLDLVEPELPGQVAAVAEPSNRAHPSATPQVDKLLALLGPQSPISARDDRPHKLARAADGVEFIELNPPLPPKEASRAAPVSPTSASAPAEIPPVLGIVAKPRRSGGPKLGVIAAAGIAAVAIGFFIWRGTSARSSTGSETLASPRSEAFGGLASADASVAVGAPSSAQPAPTPDSSAAGTDPSDTDSAPSIRRVAAPRMNLKISLPSAGLIGSAPAKTGIAPTILAQHHAAAYAEARSELELRMLQIGFTQIFLRTRLTSSSGLEDTRRLITAANGALRQYRSQESRIERAYQDTIGVAGRNLGWGPRELGTWNAKPNARETGETMRITNLLVSQMDSAFSLLLEQDGKFQIAGEAIVFEDADAARQYGALRGWLTQQADKFAGSGEGSLPATLRQVIKAIGATRLPQERRKQG